MKALSLFDRQLAGGHLFTPLEFMRREIDRAFDIANSNGWATSFENNLAGLSMDVAETDGEIIVSAEVPGVDIQDVDVSLAQGVLTIKGEKRNERDEKDANYQLIERSFGAFERRIAIPEGCDAAQVKASFANGILKVTVPKPAGAATTVKIPINKA